ncbi:hypothetical protein E0Z10_g7421 [Xylaria hypoxylon]|uniref:Uncharacterized protein n=1 Tax=Xylaria hypoxylon TaxID=37992 RepID=A0A4Z0YMQ6_9PEZI|nr:hypothetical protein E0Z10_g7421 [Xylaria hypoxylon]
MAPTRHHVLLFGDQTDNVTGSISSLYTASKKSGLLARFLQDASDICQIEFGNLQPCFRNETPPFESLLEMAENHAKTDGSPVLASCAVSYFARLGELILRAEHDPTILSTPRVLIGLCINLFPAALAATARSATELARLSLEGFPSSFSLAAANHARTKQIEQPHGSWSCMVSTRTDVTTYVTLQSLLDKFHEEHGIPEHKRTWIGVVGRGWVTVSGPPSILKLLMAECSEFEALSPVVLPVASAVHAPHLPAFDFESTAKPSYIWDLPLQEGACIMSTDDCVPYSTKTLGEVARKIIPAVQHAPLMVKGTFTATAEYLNRAGATAAVSVLGPSAQAATLIQTLKHAGIQVDVLPGPEYEPNPMERSGSGAVAIVGMSARLPQANDLDQFWKLIMEGRTTHERVPRSRFDLDDFYDPTGTKKNTMMNTDGCFLSDPGDFDARLFNMSPREAMQVDPTHRLLVMTSLEALEKAGYNREAALSSRNKQTAVYFGQNADVWREVDAEQGVDIFTAPGILRAFSPGRVSHHFGFQGGSYSVDSACSSSATAIQLACAGLINRECSMALAGGAQIASSPFEFSALGKSGFLAPSGGCKTFRADADGYCRGEAVGVLVLKRLEDALADNDNIEALITGWGRNYSAGATSMTHPYPESQEKLIRQVLRQANTKPSDIGYVELHGTGTTVGDLAEMKSITRVFGGHFKPNSPLHIGSVKANVGHSESAAGVSSVIKAALMLKKGVIPPQAMITPETQLHSGFANLDMSSIRIDSESATLEDDKKKILVNSFDAAGGNTCLLIERAPKPVEMAPDPDPRACHLVTVSAQASESLLNNKQNLLEYLVQYPETQLSSVAYSMTARRTHYLRRCEYTASSTHQLIEQLKKDIMQPNPSTTSITSKPKTVFLFNGQGTSCFGVARELHDTHPVFRGYLNALQDMCEELCPNMSRTIISILTNPDSDTDGSSVAEEHLAIVCIQLALAELWRSWGIEPDLVLGHSIGEYAALSVAGVLSVADTLWLVSKRARLFETTYQHGEYGMLSLSATSDEVLALLRDHELCNTCNIACFNSDTSHVVGGPTMDLRKLENYGKSKGIPTQFLAMSYAVHSQPMEQIYEEIEKIASKVFFFPPRIPVCSTVTGEIVDREDIFNASYIARHVCQPVQFSNALKRINAFLTEDTPSPVWIEIGPGSTCLTLLRQTLNVAPSQLLPSLRRCESNWKTLTSSLGKAYALGSPIDWLEFHRPFTRSLKLLDLPTYAFDLKTFWQPYTTATALASGINMNDREQRQNKFVPTATIQKIRHQKVSSDRIEVTFVSSLSDNRLRDAIKGHSIEGICICPASVYVDMAFTAAAYIHRMVRPDEKKSLGSLKCLELNHPFVLREDSKDQIIEVRVTAEKKLEWIANVSFHSHARNGQVEDHGSCQVLSTNSGMGTGSERQNTIQQARVRSALIMNIKDDPQAQIDHLHRRMFYKLYGTVVKYASRYQGIVEAFTQETLENPEIYEAVANVKLTATPEEERGAFMLSPYHSDSLVHIGGFALNIKLSDDDADSFYFCSGIGSITLFDELSEDKNYQSYFSTSCGPEGEAMADVYILSDNQVVGVVAGLMFHQTKRAVLKALLHEGPYNESPPIAVQAQKPALKLPSRGPGTAEVIASRPPDMQGNMADAFISALIAETGVDAKDIEDSTNLLELGVDSLMGIAIMRKMKTDTGQTLPMSLFSELRTIRDVRERLGSPNNKTSQGVGQSGFNNNTASEADQKVSPQGGSFGDIYSRSLGPRSVDLTARYKSNAVLLQGDAHSATCPLIFVAGSNGSASIYSQLPTLASSTPIWVLESPFLHRPSEMAYTPEEIAPIYVAAIKAIRPTGPYLLGGYSAGAVHAYEIARLLLDTGEDVDKLVLVDMKAHCPGDTWDEAPQMADVEMLRAVLQTDGNPRALEMPTGQLENERLFASLQCMYNWRPIPMDPGRRPKNGTVMIWARRGISHYPSQVNPLAAENKDYKAWFCAARNTYDANGWDILVGDVQTQVVDGDHWNMLRMPCAAEVSRLIDQAITSRVEN